MRRVLFLILTMLSFSTSAAWTEVPTDDEGVTTYIDLSTIREDGIKRTFWLRHDFEKPFGSFYSARTKMSLDCVQETLTTLSRDVFTEPALKGVPTNTRPPTGVQHIAPNTTGAIFLAVACYK